MLVPVNTRLLTLILAFTIVTATTLEQRQAFTLPPDDNASTTQIGTPTLTSEYSLSPSPTASGSNGEESVTASDLLGPMPTGQGECHAHEDHWHCEDEASETEEVISDEGGAGCVQHGTHFHCPAGVEANCDQVDMGEYDMPLHIGAVFVLLIASGMGVFTPVLFANADLAKRRWFSLGLFTLKHFGTGIIISTAFIHLLLHAFIMFANECLGELAYEATSPAIAMAAVIVVFLVDFFAGRWITSRQEQHAIHDRTSSEEDGGLKNDNDAIEAMGHGVYAHDHSSLSVGRQRLWDVQLLEAGVLFHSIMIGVTLGAQSGTGFVPTFCAIVFHQLFEGLGLGSRIAVLHWPVEAAVHWRKWIMCAFYMVITPVGIGIGIGVHKSFNLNGRASIISIGVLDSISAGILLYAGLCQLLVGDWLSKDSETRSPSLGQFKLWLALGSMMLGLFAMSLIGKWA